MEIKEIVNRTQSHLPTQTPSFPTTSSPQLSTSAQQNLALLLEQQNLATQENIRQIHLMNSSYHVKCNFEAQPLISKNHDHMK